MSHNRHNRGGLKSRHKKTRGGLARKAPSRSRRFPMRRG